jgi:hypothetical protein
MDDLPTRSSPDLRARTLTPVNYDSHGVYSTS